MTHVFALLLGLALLAPPDLNAGRAAAPVPADSQYAVIVHPSTPIDDLTLPQLRRVFRGEQQFWQGGKRVVLFMYPGSTSEGEFVLRHLYQMSENEFKRYWIAKTFRDDVTTGPKIVSSTAMAKRLTASVPGAVAVIPVSEVDETVKVLSVDRRFPGVDQYPLTARPRT